MHYGACLPCVQGGGSVPLGPSEELCRMCFGIVCRKNGRGKVMFTNSISHWSRLTQTGATLCLGQHMCECWVTFHGHHVLGCLRTPGPRTKTWEVLKAYVWVRLVLRQRVKGRGLENGWQRGTGARDRPSLTPVMPDRCLCLHCKVAQCSVLLWAWLTVVSSRVNVGGGWNKLHLYYR